MTKLDASISSSELSSLALTALHLAVLRDKYHDVRKIVNGKEHGVDERTASGTTSLMLAALYGRSRMFTFLLRKEASPHKKDSQGNNVLAYVKRTSPFIQDLLHKYRRIATSGACRAGRREIYGWLRVIKHTAKLAYHNGLTDGRAGAQGEVPIEVSSHTDNSIAQEPLQDPSSPVRLAYLRSLDGKQQKVVEVRCIASAEHGRIGRKCTGFIHAAGRDDARFAISGWGCAKDKNDVFKNVLNSNEYTELVRQVAGALDFELKSHHFDFHFPGCPSEKKGAYYACHAEKQLAVHVLLKALSHVFGTKSVTTNKITQIKLHLDKLPPGLRETTIHLDHELVCGNCVQFLDLLTQKSGLGFRCQSQDWFVYGERPQLRRMLDGRYAQAITTRPSENDHATEIIDDEIGIFDPIQNGGTDLQNGCVDLEADSHMEHNGSALTSTPPKISNGRKGHARQLVLRVQSGIYEKKASPVFEEPVYNNARYSKIDVTPPSRQPQTFHSQSHERITMSPSPVLGSHIFGPRGDSISPMMSPEFEVEDILQTVERDGIRFFLVKWKAYPHDNNTWEPEENLGNASEIIEKFWKELQEESEMHNPSP